MLIPAVLSAGPVVFSGQFHPLLAEFRPRGGDGWFDPSAAPWGVTLYGSNSGLGRTILTTVGWDVPTGGVYSFLWSYQTGDNRTPSYDQAGYFRGIPAGSGWTWILTRLSANNGPAMQSGWVGGINLSPGDRFGFYVWSIDDFQGRASLTVYTPEPASLGLAGLGLIALGLWARRRSQS
jgi:hypothetical protein